MLSYVTSVAIVGVEPCPITVEAHVSRAGREVFAIVGLPDTAVREAKERVRSALAASGYSFPKRRVIINLSPADLPKAGAAYDLPIALAVLAANNDIDLPAGGVVALGELALDGGLRPVRGGLAAGVVARSLGAPCLLPPRSAADAAVLAAVDIVAVADLDAAAKGRGGSPPATEPVPSSRHADLSDVRGQLLARRGLEIAAAGGHHLLMSGAPGAGKTMLARTLPGILPPLEPEETLDVALAWAAAGRRRSEGATRPFRAPHHSATLAALVGGGSGVPTPGEVTLANHGVLFLDELGEFPVHVLDALRQPLEDGAVTVARQGAAVEFPSRLQLVAATNPCPCGYQGDRLKQCRCSERGKDRYRQRLSGPLLDRIDMRVRVDRLDPSDYEGPAGESSAAVGRRVLAARKRQLARGGLNRDLTASDLSAADWTPDAKGLLQRSIESAALTARGWTRVRRVAVTIADLAASTTIQEPHAAEALALRAEQ